MWCYTTKKINFEVVIAFLITACLIVCYFLLNLLQVSLVGLWQTVTCYPQCLQSLIWIRNTAHKVAYRQTIKKKKERTCNTIWINVRLNVNSHPWFPCVLECSCLILIKSPYCYASVHALCVFKKKCAPCCVSFTLRLESTHHKTGRSSVVQAALSGMTSGLLIIRNQCKTKT